MSTLNKQFYRTAARLQQALVRQRGQVRPITLPSAQWQRLATLVSALEIALGHNWQSAARARRRHILDELDRLQRSLADLQHRLAAETAYQPLASQGELYRDLLALAAEFPRIAVLETACTLCVTTEPVILEGLVLGPFEIRLVADDGGPLSYQVVALEPNPARSNLEITHPHVNGDQLCEGDGRRALAAALADGRLFDFFSIVNQLLHTYAAGRAYVELENWQGVPCHECGTTIDEDDRCHCGACDQTLCLECACSCVRCGEGLCFHCAGPCPVCSEIHCASCLEQCVQCGTRVCQTCLQENLCPRCFEHEQDDRAGDSEMGTAPSAQAAVYADRLGEAPLST